MKKCVVCGKGAEGGVTVDLRPDEEAALAKTGVETPGRLSYCKACWRILEDPVAAPQLIRSTAERVMLQYGVPPLRAKAAADKLFMRLVEVQRRRLHKSLA